MSCPEHLICFPKVDMKLENKIGTLLVHVAIQIDYQQIPAKIENKHEKL